MAARKKTSKKTQSKTKPSKKPWSKPKVKQIPVEEVSPTTKAKLLRKAEEAWNKILDVAENDPDKLVAGAASLLNNTERLVQAVKENPEEAKAALRNGVIKLAVSMMRVR